MELEAVVSTMADQMEALNRRYPVAGRLLLCSLWSDPASYTEEILELVRRHRERGIIVGMDVAGDEAHPSRGDHLQVLPRLAAAGAHLEMCPSCNVQLGLYADHASHPARQFIEAGVSVGISTDQRTITHTTVGTEYERLAAADPWWTVERFRSCNRAALAASFAGNPTRQRVAA